MLQAIEETTPLTAESVPRGAMFWSAQYINYPPLPSNINNLPAWNLGGGNWLLADQDFDYAALEQQNAAMHMLSKAMGLEMDSQEVDDNSYTIDTNGLWLEIAGVSNGAAWFNLHNSTNQVYAIWSTTDLLVGWNVAAEVWPTNSEVMPFTVPTLERQNLFVRAEDWTGVDSDGDGIPDWWIWKYFGDLSENATNLDSQGNTLLDDYQNVVDPNVIQFSLPFTNYYVNTLNVPVQLNISGGVPSYMAVLINDMNQDDAVWQPYTSSNIVVTLGSTNGAYGIFVGLRGLPPDATQTWRWASATLYFVAPLLTITSPATGMVSQSLIQLQGYASQPLESLAFDVSNAAGVVTNQPGFLTGQFYDTSLLAYTTNYFECSDIVLNDGTNVITLHATDWAGNTMSVSFTLDYSADTNPPVLNLVWPQDGTPISGSQFTLQAQVSDPKATVTASINGNTVQGLVEQNGTVWVQNLSLNAGTNAVTLTASNAVGGVSVTNFNVIGNDVGLVINPLTSDQMNQPSVIVTGFIGDPVDDCVVVNGVKAAVYDDGFWEADGVPVNPTGTASLYVQVYVGDPVLIASQKADKPQPAMVVLAGYSGSINTHDSFQGWPCLDVRTINWAHDSGGNETDTGYVPTDACIAEGYFNFTDGLPADGPGFATPELGLVWDYFSVNVPYGDNGGSFQRLSKAQPMIAPSGQQPAGTTNVYLVLVSASEYSNPIQGFGSTPGDMPQPPEWWRYKGEALVNTGITNTNGAVWGATLVSALAGKTPIITLTNTQCYSNNAASLNMQVTNVTIQSLTVVSNSATQIDATNWAVVKTPTNDYVIVQATFNYTNDWFLTNATLQAEAGAAIQWSGGEPVPGNLLQRRVSKTNSVETTVTASLGSSTTNLNVWVIWATINYQFSGTTPANAQVLWTNTSSTLQSHLMWYMPGFTLGVQVYPDMTGPPPENFFVAGTNAYAKECSIIQIQPVGINEVVTNGFNIIQYRWCHEFIDGNPNQANDDYSTDWVLDGPFPAYRNTHAPDSYDKVYAIDGPGIGKISSGVNMYEVHQNYFDYETFNGTRCSDTNYWHFEAAWFAGPPQVINRTNLGNGLISLPTTNQWTQ